MPFVIKVGCITAPMIERKYNDNSCVRANANDSILFDVARRPQRIAQEASLFTPSDLMFAIVNSENWFEECGMMFMALADWVS